MFLPSYNLFFALFTIEKLYDIHIDKLDRQLCIHLDKENYITIFEMLSARQKEAKKYETGEIAKKEYDQWHYISTSRSR